MDVYENMAFGARLMGLDKPEVESRIAETSRMLRLEGLLKRKPRELSGGQRQRVAIGRALVRKPDVFLLDEPLSNLDAALRAQVRLEIAKLHRDIGATMIYVTHDQVEAMTLADRIVVMNNGLIEQVGTPRELYEHPANTFVATFIGSPRMNLLGGRVTAKNGTGPTFEAASGWKVPLDAGELRASDGQTVTLGIRPEDIVIVDTTQQGDFTATVAIVERLGAETYLNVRQGSDTLLVRVQGDLQAQPGEPVHLAMNRQRFHIFDQAERSILH
jgi:multiple sugar transport system ATP-binding protein